MVQNLIDNDKDLKNVILKDLPKVIKRVCEKILEEVLKPSIISEVYNVYEPVAYERQKENGGFLGSWISSEVKKGGSQMESVIFSDPERMVLDPPIHGWVDSFYSEDLPGDAFGASGYMKLTDRRPFLDKFIAEGVGYDFMRPKERLPVSGKSKWFDEPRDYWSPVLDKLNKTSLFYNIVFDAFREELGIRLVE